MSGGTRIIPIDGGQSKDSHANDTSSEGELLLVSPLEDDTPPRWPESWNAGEEESPSPRLNWLAPAITCLAITGWTGFFAWANLAAIQTGASPAQWSQWVAQWSMPVLLCLVALLVALRTSKREAVRFGDIARSLSLESERLEKRLGSVNTELSLARDFIAAQSRDLESLGRVAVERLSGSATKLEALVSTNGAQVDRIGEVSVSALENMEKLRGQLPVIANAAKDVTNNIGNAGRTAHVQLEELVAGLQRLNEFGLASERQVASFRERVDEALAEFGRAAAQLDEVSAARFAALASESEQHRDRLDQEEIAALAAIRGRSQALAAELAEHQAAAAAAEADALEALRARFVALREESINLARTIGTSENAALTAWGERSAHHVVSLRSALDSLGAEQEKLLTESTERLAQFEQSARSLTGLLEDQARGFDEQFARRRASTEAAAAQQREALTKQLTEVDQAISERQEAMATTAAEAVEALSRKLAELDHVIEAQRERQVAEAARLGEQCEAIGRKITEFSDVLRNSSEQGVITTSTVDQGLNTLTNRLSEMRHALAGTDLQIGELTDSSVRLLELIQAGSEHTRTQMPEALRSTEAGLQGLEDRVFTLRDTLREAGDGGRTLSEAVAFAREGATATMADVKQTQEAMAEHAARQEQQLAALRDVLAKARKESDALSQDIDGRLSGAIAQLAEAAGKAGEQLRISTGHEIETLAEKLGEESSAALTRVLQGRAAELIGRLEEAIDTAASASRDTAIQMRDQLAKVDELAGNLETRVNRARERAEEQIDNDFARRAALITESLNSTAIDVSKALSADVSETAWASYLRGDRGIFTRRAVSLLESAEAKAVQQHYEGDSEFRENVNRYIHDFEAMLRQLLSTRDGNALGVTLLSSDMGKLYVALAQGIERLRA